MVAQTPNYHLEQLRDSDPLSTDDYKFTYSDRALIDRLLKLGAETHHHTGVSAASLNPTSAPTLSDSTSGGTIAAGVTAYYEYTWVDGNGLETAPSPFSSVAMPAQCATPSAPTLTFSSSSGTLTAGSYLYLLTAYTGSSTAETLPSLAASITTVATGEIVVHFPALPSGADGFNIYRFAPGGNSYLYMVTVAVSGGTPTSWTDDGSVGANCNRFPPGANTTNSTNSVLVTLPTAIPSGYTWNLYRTYDNTNWNGSLLASVTSGATTYTDTGAATTSGAPPTASLLVGTPTKILLTGGAEVQGTLPASMVEGGSAFTAAGQIEVGTGSGTSELLAKGSSGNALTVGGADPSGLEWVPVVASFNTRTGAVTLSAADVEGLFTAAGDIFVGTGAGTGKILPKGSATNVLTVGGADPSGLEWAPASGGGGSSFTYTGSGLPEGVQTGSPGESYLDTTGGGIWFKFSGTATNTGWVLGAHVDRSSYNGLATAPAMIGFLDEGTPAIPTVNILGGVPSAGSSANCVYISDVVAYNNSGNGILYTSGSADGEQTIQIYLGPSGVYNSGFWRDGSVTLCSPGTTTSGEVAMGTGTTVGLKHSIITSSIRTTDATPTALKTPDGTAYSYKIGDTTSQLLISGTLLAARTDTRGTASAWSLGPALIRGNGTSLAWVSGSAPTFTLISQDSAASTWSATIAEATVSSAPALVVTVTGEAAEQIDWMFTLTLDRID